jgi:hypothetical protein
MAPREIFLVMHEHLDGWNDNYFPEVAFTDYDKAREYVEEANRDPTCKRFVYRETIELDPKKWFEYD